MDFLPDPLKARPTRTICIHQILDVDEHIIHQISLVFLTTFCPYNPNILISSSSHILPVPSFHTGLIRYKHVCVIFILPSSICWNTDQALIHKTMFLITSSTQCHSHTLWICSGDTVLALDFSVVNHEE